MDLSTFSSLHLICIDSTHIFVISLKFNVIAHIERRIFQCVTLRCHELTTNIPFTVDVVLAKFLHKCMIAITVGVIHHFFLPSEKKILSDICLCSQNASSEETLLIFLVCAGGNILYTQNVYFY